jgi:hypothetical protein
MKVPTPYELWVIAEQLRSVMQQRVKHIPCKLPERVTCYFDGKGNLVGYGCTIWAEQQEVGSVGRIDVITPDITHVTFTFAGIMAQGAEMRAYLTDAYGVYIYKSYDVVKGGKS